MVREGPSESGNQEQPRGKGVEGEGWAGESPVSFSGMEPMAVS